jgi:hypothetical protein
MLCMENSLEILCADGVIAHSLLQSTEENITCCLTIQCPRKVTFGYTNKQKNHIDLTSPKTYEHNSYHSSRQGVTRI